MLTQTKNLKEAPASETCCALFDPVKWDNIKHEWDRKVFLKDSLPEFLHIPLPGTYAKTIKRMWNMADRAGAAPARNDFLLLAHDPSAFKAELYMYVTREVPGAVNVRLSGTFYSKVFEANYGDVPKCLRKMDEFLASNDMVAVKHYINFPYCPKCAKKYGHNYVVVVTEVEAL